MAQSRSDKQKRGLRIALLVSAVIILATSAYALALLLQIPSIGNVFSSFSAGTTASDLSSGRSEGTSTTSNTGQDTQLILDNEAAPEVRISMVMVGDMLAHRGVWTSGQRTDGTRNYDHLFTHTREIFQEADLALIDQETPLGGDALGISGYPIFNSPQEVGDAEVNAGFDVILSATNHSVDKGQAGVSATLNFWRTAHPNTVVVGMYDSQADYDNIYVYEKDGFKVAVLNYTYDTNGMPIPEENPWAVALLDEDKVARDIELANSLADMVVACPHWGEEYVLYPTDYQRYWAQFMANRGVDVIFGAHPHVIEPVEVIEGEFGNQTLVFWSVGNYCSGQPELETATEGIASVVLVKDTARTRIESWSFTPLVCHQEAGEAYTVYPLRDYSDELAARSWTQVQSVASVDDLCARVLGDAYNREEHILCGGEVSTG